MIFGLYGGSCCGKSIIGEKLSEISGLPLRKCGEEVKNYAKNLNKNLDDLSRDDHTLIDTQTIEWAKSNTPCLVEGRYLPFVFHDFGANAMLIHLECEINVRAKRMKDRYEVDDGMKNIQTNDESDSKITECYSRNVAPLDALITYDTTAVSVDEAAYQLLKLLQYE